MPIEDRNYLNDPRVRAADRGERRFTIEIDGEEHELPTMWEVCPTCHGEGTHVNPSIDANGLTAEDFAADPDFAEEYFSGTYDVQCYECKGRTTVRTVDMEACEPHVLQAWIDAQREEAEYLFTCRAERAMGA